MLIHITKNKLHVNIFLHFLGKYENVSTKKYKYCVIVFVCILCYVSSTHIWHVKILIDFYITLKQKKKSIPFDKDAHNFVKLY